MLNYRLLKVEMIPPVFEQLKCGQIGNFFLSLYFNKPKETKLISTRWTNRMDKNGFSLLKVLVIVKHKSILVIPLRLLRQNKHKCTWHGVEYVLNQGNVVYFTFSRRLVLPWEIFAFLCY